MRIFFQPRKTPFFLLRQVLPSSPLMISDRRNSSGPKIREFSIHTDVSLSFRPWGVDRLVLDSLCNHLPYDSQGTIFRIKILQLGSWLDFRHYDARHRVEQICFEDNGRGYDAKLFSILDSTKRISGRNTGQFGEGLKLCSSAALRLNIAIEFYSQNWQAKPFIFPETVDGISIPMLAFSVREGLSEIRGSKTIISNPPEEFVEELFRIPEEILFFYKGFQTLFLFQGIPVSRQIGRLLGTFPTIVPLVSYPKPAPDSESGIGSRILNLGRRDKVIFIKGVRKKTSIPVLFDYDLITSAISPDRDIVDEEAAKEIIWQMLRFCDQVAVIDRLLDAATHPNEGKFLEFQTINERSESIQGKRNGNDAKPVGEIFPFFHRWRERFRVRFGKDAYLASEEEDLNIKAQDQSNHPVVMNPGMKKFLRKLGIPSVDDLFADEVRREEVKMEWLSEKARIFLHMIPSIHQHLEIPAIPELTIFSGSQKRGIYATGQAPKPRIFLHEKSLTNFKLFLKTYLMALAELQTGQTGVARPFVDFFVRSWSQLIQKTLE